MKFLKLTPVFFLLIFFSSFTEIHAFKVKLTTIEYPPLFQSKYMQGLGYGVASDLTVQAFKAAGIDAEFDYIPMIRSVESVISKKYPANLGSINWFTKDQKEHLVEVVDLFYIHFLLFYKKENYPDGISYENLSEFKKYTVGNVRGSSTTPVVTKAGLNIEWVSKLELNFKKLHADRLNFAIGGETAGWTLIKELYPDDADKFAAVKKPVLTVPIGLVFHKDESDLLDKFKTGINIILENGKYYEIMKRYYKEDQVINNILPQNALDKIKKE